MDKSLAELSIRRYIYRSMPNTPFFPAWRPCLAALGSRTTQALCRVRSYTLCQLETCLGPWVPPELFPKAADKENSRDRNYTRWRTFWCMLWQALNPDAPGREVVRQLQAVFRLENGPRISAQDGAYCRARARLPLEEFPKALTATARSAAQLAPPLSLLGGRPLKAVDGCALTLLADTKKNRKAYPSLQCRPNQPSFPMLRGSMMVDTSDWRVSISGVSSCTLSTSVTAPSSIFTSSPSVWPVLRMTFSRT